MLNRTTHGIHNLGRPEGWVSVGIDHDTASFAVHAIERGWEEIGRERYPGRTGIYELLVVDDDICAEVAQRRGVGEIRRLATAKGMQTLLDDALRQVLAGVTTPDGAMRGTRA
jgi:type II secretory ATPase GspE/PulE/Tfp pilus assembly ATPase PilB-like protein